MENDLIARKLNLLTVFFPALAPSYKEIILNSFDQYSLLKAYVRRIMDNYPGIQAEDHEKLEKALTQSLRDSEVDCILNSRINIGRIFNFTLNNIDYQFATIIYVGTSVCIRVTKLRRSGRILTICRIKGGHQRFI